MRNYLCPYSVAVAETEIGAGYSDKVEETVEIAAAANAPDTFGR